MKAGIFVFAIVLIYLVATNKLARMTAVLFS